MLTRSENSIMFHRITTGIRRLYHDLMNEILVMMYYHDYYDNGRRFDEM